MATEKHPYVITFLTVAQSRTYPGEGSGTGFINAGTVNVTIGGSLVLVPGASIFGFFPNNPGDLDKSNYQITFDTAAGIKKLIIVRKTYL